MANIHDYLDLRGDIKLEERPFNVVDGLVLSVLSYVDFTGIVPGEGEGPVTVSYACEALLDRAGGDVSPYVRSLAKIDERYLRLLGSSKRFGQALVQDYVDVFDHDRDLQFAALTVELPGGLRFVSFRGTDNSLVGWREDFMLSFEVTEAQRLAAEYLLRQARHAEAEGVRLMVGGHSKGGNLASFSAVLLPEELQHVIERVYSNDGPLMASEVVPLSCHDVYGDRFVRIVPTYSVVGMLFDDPAEPKTIVRSTGDGALQHDPTTWQVHADCLDEADDLLPQCKLVNAIFDKWMRGANLADRELFTRQVFDAFEAGGATTFDEVMGNPASTQRVLAALRDADPRTKELLGELVQVAAGKTWDATVAAVASATRAALSAVGAMLSQHRLAGEGDAGEQGQDEARVLPEGPAPVDAAPDTDAEDASL